ncbi:MAG: glutamate 5-kinase [Eubacterium sp.]|nr:glutamate 5-kinase [Eubacterium sp.]
MALENGKKRIVVKVGTSTLTHKTGKTNIAVIAKLASVLSDLKNEGHQIILVSSGAIGIGMSRLRISEKPKETKCLQAAAAVGQCELMFLYDKLFSEYDVVVSQLLFTSDALKKPESKMHLIDTFNQLLDYDCLPIVNENDSVSVEELLNGDNDCLSATVAVLTDSDLLILLTDTDGLYDSNPAENRDARLISRVEKIDDNIKAIAGGAGKKGTGGFITKIKAAEIAVNAGIPVVIANGSRPTDIYHILRNQQTGTYFEAVKND